MYSTTIMANWIRSEARKSMLCPSRMPVHGLLEVRRVHQADEVADLIQAVGRVQGAQRLELLARGRGLAVLGPIARQLAGVLCQQLPELPAELGRALGLAAAGVQRRRQQTAQEGPARGPCLLVDLGLGVLDEDVGRTDLVLRHLAVTRTEGEESLPPSAVGGVGDEKAGPGLVLVLEECDRASALLKGAHVQALRFRSPEDDRGHDGGQAPTPGRGEHSLDAILAGGVNR